MSWSGASLKLMRWRLLVGCVGALLMAHANAQPLDVSPPSRSGNRCTQTILYPLASSRSGAIGLMAQFTSTDPSRVHLTVALRHRRPIFGLEPFVKAQHPDIVTSVLEMERARMGFGTFAAMHSVDITDLGYVRNTGTEFVTFALPLEAFVSLTLAPLLTLGRIDTQRAFLEFELPPPFFAALADGFNSVCLADTVAVDGGAAAMTSDGDGSAQRGETLPIPIEGYLPTQPVDLGAIPLLFIEDVRRPEGPVRFIERERHRWLELTIVEISPEEEDLGWFGWMGGDSMIVFDRAGDALMRHQAPYSFRLQDVTGDGALELVVESPASGASGCCDAISVFAQQVGTLRKLLSVSAFGSVRLVDLDGDGVQEVVGDARLPSSTLPNVARVQVPYACAWDGTRMIDVTTTVGTPFVDAWMVQRRDRLTSTSDTAPGRAWAAAGRELVAAALLFGMPAALDELQWLVGTIGPELTREVMTDVDDFAANLVDRDPCR